MGNFAKQGREHCLLTVANQGEEISPKDLSNLFKRFYRADQARSRTGSFGLGLSIAESIVIQHKGKIWAESKNTINTFLLNYRNIILLFELNLQCRKIETISILRHSLYMTSVTV